MARPKHTLKVGTLWLVTTRGKQTGNVFVDRAKAVQYAKSVGGQLWKGRPEWKQVQR